MICFPSCKGDETSYYCYSVVCSLRTLSCIALSHAQPTYKVFDAGPHLLSCSKLPVFQVTPVEPYSPLGRQTASLIPQRVATFTVPQGFCSPLISRSLATSTSQARPQPSPTTSTRTASLERAKFRKRLFR